MTEQQVYNALAAIFAAAPEECTEIRLSVRIIYGADLHTLTGYLHYGAGTWQRFDERDDQIPVTTELFRAAARRHGYGMADRPTKRSSTEFLYTFAPQPVGHEYRLESWTADQLERRRREDRFSEMFAEQLSA